MGFDDIDGEDVESLLTLDQKEEIEKYRFDCLLQTMITLENTSDHNELAERAVYIMTELGVESALVELGFKKGLKVETVIGMNDEQKILFCDACKELKNKTVPVFNKKGPFRKRYKIEDGAFEKFEAIMEMLNNQVLGGGN